MISLSHASGGQLFGYRKTSKFFYDDQMTALTFIDVLRNQPDEDAHGRPKEGTCLVSVQLTESPAS